MNNISTFILTYNEEIHIERCISNAKKFAKHIYLVDSFSTDKTIEIAKEMGAIVYQNKWDNNYARQFNWGLSNIPFETEWVLRLDADEYFSDALIDELKEKFSTLNEDVSGIIFERKMIFMDKLMKRGMIKMNMLRLFRLGHGICEDRWMDEHIILNQGKTIVMDHYFVDHNLNTLGWWTTKHNNYSIREAIDLLDAELGLIGKIDVKALLSPDAAHKRAKKLKYSKMPLFWRSFFYFVYRYFVKLGFTEGKVGFLWHFLQGWWYRTLVDAKIYEIRKHCGSDVIKIKEFIRKNYQIDL